MSIASYSTSLLNVRKPNLMDCSSSSPIGDMRMTTTSTPFFFEESSTYIIHVSPFLLFLMKSANTWPLRLYCSLYSILNSPNSMAHLTSRPKSFDLCKTTHIGHSIRTTMACSWKYGLSFLAIVCSTRATFSS